MIEAETEKTQLEEQGQDTGVIEPVDTQGAQDAQESEAVAKETEQAGHFKKLRDARERAERERDEAIQMIRQMEERQKPPPPEEDMGYGADEDLAEIKHIKKIAKQQKELEKQLQEYKQHSSKMTAEARLKAQYQDLEKVLTDANIEALKEEDPDLMTSIQYNPDTFSKYSAAYKAIKRLGIYKDKNYDADKQKAKENANKPRPLTSVSPQQGDSPLSRANAFANGLTPELKASLLKEMQESRKSY